MPSTTTDAYLETEILTADPVELVRMLYRAAVDATRRAMEHLAGGRIAERSREISRALAILWELSASLDHTRGGTLSRSLAELYDYLERRLLEANMRQEPAPLAEVERLLTTLLEGWGQVRPPDERRDDETSRHRPAAEYSPYGAFPPLAADPGVGYSTQTWSL